MSRALPLVGYIVLAVAIGFGFLRLESYADANRERIRENAKATVALCALEDDLQRRVESSRAFLKANPEGIPGIPPAMIEMSIANSQRTIETLNVLNCEQEE